MRIRGIQTGFTLVEVMLFIVLSSTMIVVAVTSIGSRTKNVQFNDSVRAAESFFERRTALVEAGSLVSEDTQCRWTGISYSYSSPSDGSCIFLGYVFEFGEPLNPGASDPSRNEVYVYQIFGRRMNSSDVANCIDPTQVLACARPVRVPATPVETLELPWGAEITYARDQDFEMQPNYFVKGFGFLRDPVGTGVIPVSYSTIHSNLSGFRDGIDATSSYNTAYEIDEPLTRVGGEFGITICISDLESRVAQLSFGEEQRTDSINVDYVSSSSTGLECSSANVN